MADLKALLARWYEQVINGRDMDVAAQMLAPNFKDHTPPPMADLPDGIEGFKMIMGMWMEGLPDIKIRSDKMVQDGDWISSRFTLTATMTGPFMGSAPTGRSFEVGGMEMARFSDGKFVERWGYIDMGSMMMQLGLAPTP